MSENIIHAYMAAAAGQPLTLEQYDLGELKPDDVELQVEYCGLCHSDLSIIEDDWGVSQYPVIPGHEVVGKIVRIGSAVKTLTVGQRVGLGWTSESCASCQHCLSGDQVLCAELVPTIVGHAGGFAEKVRAHWQWVIPLPDELDAECAGPLLCGGITVFNPILTHQIQAVHRVGVIGIGGLGHLALKMLKAWGCEITAFTSSLSKRDDLMAMGADHVYESLDYERLEQLHGKFDLIISTVNVGLDWTKYTQLLAPKGSLHFVGAVLTPAVLDAGLLMSKSLNVTGSDTGTPVMLRQLMEFAARKQIYPDVEVFPMSEVNLAIEHLKQGKARYRVVLKADFKN